MVRGFDLDKLPLNARVWYPALKLLVPDQVRTFLDGLVRRRRRDIDEHGLGLQGARGPAEEENVSRRFQSSFLGCCFGRPPRWIGVTS
jgi:hypothetical protein